jgi:hypothetical protein
MVLPFENFASRRSGIRYRKPPSVISGIAAARAGAAPPY